MARKGKNISVYFKTHEIASLEKYRERANEGVAERSRHNQSSWIVHLAMVQLALSSPRMARAGDVVAKCDACDRDILHDEEFFCGEEVTECSDCMMSDEELEDAWRADAVPRCSMFYASVEDDSEHCGTGGSIEEAITDCLLTYSDDQWPASDAPQREVIAVSKAHPLVLSDHTPDIFDGEIYDHIAAGIYDTHGEMVWGREEIPDEHWSGLNKALAATLKTYLRANDLDRQPSFGPGPDEQRLEIEWSCDGDEAGVYWEGGRLLAD